MNLCVCDAAVWQKGSVGGPVSLGVGELPVVARPPAAPVSSSAPAAAWGRWLRRFSPRTRHAGHRDHAGRSRTWPTGEITTHLLLYSSNIQEMLHFPFRWSHCIMMLIGPNEIFSNSYWDNIQVPGLKYIFTLWNYVIILISHIS